MTRHPGTHPGTIEARGLTMTYKARGRLVEAVRGVDLDVADGEIVGFLGPNGAGKTTTLRILTTLLQPTGGRAVIAGADLFREATEVRRRIGYVAQQGSTQPEALVSEELSSQGQLFGLSRAEATKRGQKLLADLDLDGVWRRTARSLSGGQRRRLDIAMGLLHLPSLIFLDEPTTGLDPQARANLWRHIRRLRDELGTTVFLTTHYLDEADALCDRIMVIDAGRLVADGTPDALKARVAGDSIELELVDAAALQAARSLVQAMAGVVDVTTETRSDGVARLALRTADSGRRLPALLRDLDAAGIGLLGVETHRPTLDDVFLTLTGRSLRDETEGVGTGGQHVRSP